VDGGGIGRLILLAASLGCLAESPVVTPAWVKAQRNAIVAEVSWNSSKDYDAGHIPGAIHINTDAFENGSPRWHLRPVSELHAAIGKLGIRPDSTVVIYSAKTIAAARVWWVLSYAGVRDVRYLDGGLAAWKRAGYAVSTTPARRPPAQFFAPTRDELLATTDYVKTAKDAVLADVRSPREFRGDVSGYSYLDAKGRIPGAVAVNDADDSARLYQNADGTLRDLASIRARWRAAGILDGREIVFYCGGGWRSSLAFLYARAMGLANVRNYSDGWSAWSTLYDQPDGKTWRQRPSGNPIARGR